MKYCRDFCKFSTSILFLFSLSNSNYVLANPIYVPALESIYHDWEILESYQIPDAWAVKYPLCQDQKGTASCASHASYYLIEYIRRVLHKSDFDTESDKQSFSLFDLWAVATKNRARDVAQIYNVLYNLKDKTLYSAIQLDLEKIWALSIWCTSRTSEQLSDPEWKKAYLEKLIVTLSEAQIEINYEILNRIFEVRKLKPSTMTLSIIRDYISKVTDSKSLQKVPSYNAYIIEDEGFRDDSPQSLRETKNTRLLKKLHSNILDLLSPNNSFSKSFPLAMDVCEREGVLGCDVEHVLIIEGARTVSYRIPGQMTGLIEMEIKVKNSYGGAKEGWLRAEPIYQSFFKYYLSLAYLRPGTTDQSRDEKTIEPVIQGSFPAFYAAEVGDQIGLEYLLKVDRDSVNRPNSAGQTPIFAAVVSDNELAIDTLIAAGADLDIVDKYGQSILFFTSRFNKPTMLRLILSKKKFDLDCIVPDDSTLLLDAANRGNSEIVDILLDAGAQIDKPSMKGQTALMLAASRGYLQIVRTLAGRGANVNPKHILGFNALYVALHTKNIETAQFLISSGANIQDTLAFARKNGDKEVINDLRGLAPSQVN